MRRRTNIVAAILTAGCFPLASTQAADVDSTTPARLAPADLLTAQATQPGGQSDMTPSEKAARSRLESAGYTQIRDIKSGPEGTTARAIKDGKDVSVVVDSAGKIKESPLRP
ncbi:MAG TPA: hypothetical protein VJR58_25225 [Vineibacter sp.]|nr:hypothetical protein [Vineibacter sp.]